MQQDDTDRASQRADLLAKVTHSQEFRVRYDRIVDFEPYDNGFGITRDAQTAKPQSFRTGKRWFGYNFGTDEGTPMRRIFGIVLLLAATLAAGCSGQEPTVVEVNTPEPQEVQLRILAINDFHGAPALLTLWEESAARTTWQPTSHPPGRRRKTPCSYPPAT